MTDSKKDTFDLGSNEDFDFNKIADFESDASSNADPSEDFASFGGPSDTPGFAFDDDKTEFAPSDDAADFGSEFEPGEEFAAQDSNPFDFAEPPSPESVELASMNGDPDQEFGDFGGTDTTSGFYAGGNDAQAVDPFAEDNGDTYQSSGDVDPFADDGDDASAEEPAQEAAQREPSKLGIKQIASFAAVVAVVGYVGYSQVLPMFVSQDTGGQVLADNTPLIEQGPLADSLPSTETNVMPTPTPVDGVTDIAAVQPIDEPVSETPQLTLPGLETATETVQPADPVSTDTELVGLDKAPSIDLPATETKPATSDPMDDFVGGTDRGGIASMKDAEPVEEVAAPVVPVAQLDAVTKRLDDVVRRIESIERRVADLASTGPVSKPSAAIPVEVSDTVTVPANPGVSAPLKPPIIETAVLRGVSRDVAWIATGNDVVEVKVGDTIPEAGTVESFQNYRGRWIAVTDKGIILPR